MMRIAAVLACLCAPAPALLAQQGAAFEYLFTIGGSGGVNPAQRFAAGAGRVFFGSPQPETPVISPQAVAVDREDRIWITDRGARSVHMFDLLRGKYRQIGRGAEAQLQCPSGIDVDIHGNAYVADACLGQIFVFDQDGGCLRRLLGRAYQAVIERPAALLVSHDLKSIYVSDPPRSRVVVLNQEGESVREWGGADGGVRLGSPTALAVDPENDRIMVLDSAGGRVNLFTPGGGFIRSLTWPGARTISAFTFDAETRRFFVGDSRFTVILVSEEDGTPVSAFGKAGAGLDEMRGPTGLYVDFRQRIYVTDSSGGKVLVFRHTSGRQ